MKRSPMPPRRSPLRRVTLLRARPAIEPLEGPWPRRKRAKNDTWAFRQARARSFGMSGGLCVVCGCLAQHGHHRIRRSQGGADIAENVVPVCWAHHDMIHRHRSVWAREVGLLLRSTDELRPWWELPIWTERHARWGGDAA